MESKQAGYLVCGLSTVAVHFVEYDGLIQDHSCRDMEMEAPCIIEIMQDWTTIYVNIFLRSVNQRDSYLSTNDDRI